MSVFGKAKFGGNKRNWFKLKDGENGPYRILPPMGDLQEDGRWSVFYNVHYGYKNSKGELRTFQSPLQKNRKTKMVEVPDAALDRINQLKALLEQAKKEGNEAKVAKLLELVGGKKSRYNLDNNHYMNVVDLQGNVGLLKIRHRAKLALDAQIKKLRDAGIEPLDPETGRFFTFTRSGMGQETIYQVSVYKKKLTVQGVGEVEQDVVHTITPELANRCITEKADGTYNYKEAARLDQLFKRPTAEEVAKMVELGPAAVDVVFDSNASATAEAADQDDSGFEDDETPATAAPAPAAVDTELAQRVAYAEAAAKAAAEAKAITEAAAKKAEEDARLAAAAATQPAPVTSGVATLGAAKTKTAPVAEQSDEDFLKSLGL